MVGKEANTCGPNIKDVFGVLTPENCGVLGAANT